MNRYKTVSIWKDSSPTFSSINGQCHITKELSWYDHSLFLYSPKEDIGTVYCTYTKWTKDSEYDFFEWLKSLTNLRELEISFSIFRRENLVPYLCSQEAKRLEKIHINGNNDMIYFIPKEITSLSCNISTLNEIVSILSYFPNLENLTINSIGIKDEYEQDIISALYNHPNVPQINIRGAYYMSNIQKKLLNKNFYSEIKNLRDLNSRLELILCYEYVNKNNCPLSYFFESEYFDLYLLTVDINSFLR